MLSCKDKFLRNISHSTAGAQWQSQVPEQGIRKERESRHHQLGNRIEFTEGPSLRHPGADRFAGQREGLDDLIGNKISI
jgi:hypothetical protein